MIQLHQVSFSYQKDHRIINTMTFSFDAGHQYFIQGNNGVGKTTLLKLILGLITPTSGFLKRTGQFVVSYLPDHNGLYEFLTVKQNIQFRLGIYHIPFRSKKAEVEHFMDYFNLSQYENTLICNLSFGTKKKAAILCALIVDADILVLDEPSSGLDALAKKQLINTIGSQAGPQKMTICITHEPDWATRSECTRLRLEEGRLIHVDL